MCVCVYIYTHMQMHTQTHSPRGRTIYMILYIWIIFTIWLIWNILNLGVPKWVYIFGQNMCQFGFWSLAQFPSILQNEILCWWLQPPTLPPHRPWFLPFQWPWLLHSSNHPHPECFSLYIQRIYLFWNLVLCTLPKTYGTTTIKIRNRSITSIYFPVPFFIII